MNWDGESWEKACHEADEKKRIASTNRKARPTNGNARMAVHQSELDPTAAPGPPVIPVDLWAKFDPPSLPLGLLPPVLERFAVEQGEMMGADPGGLAAASLAVCGGHPGQHSDPGQEARQELDGKCADLGWHYRRSECQEKPNTSTGGEAAHALGSEALQQIY
jgi:hypothetical protein